LEVEVSQAPGVLRGELGLEMKATLRFSMALGGVQNIVDTPAPAGGWQQACTFRRRLGRRWW
jgi:hypothetical protein